MNALKWIECRIYGVTILIVGLMLTPLVFAQQTWDYTGMAISGDIVLGTALANGTETVTPSSFSFGTINQSNDPGATFQFTVENSTITAWSVQLADNLALGNTYTGQSLRSTQAGDTYSAYVSSPSCASEPQECSHESVISSAGVWTDPPAVKKVTAPEVDWARAAEALTLLFCAVLFVKAPGRL
jgi:hypothetical protein